MEDLHLERRAAQKLFYVGFFWFFTSVLNFNLSPLARPQAHRGAVARRILLDSLSQTPDTNTGQVRRRFKLLFVFLVFTSSPDRKSIYPRLPAPSIPFYRFPPALLLLLRRSSERI